MNDFLVRNVVYEVYKLQMMIIMEFMGNGDLRNYLISLITQSVYCMK